MSVRKIVSKLAEIFYYIIGLLLILLFPIYVKRLLLNIYLVLSHPHKYFSFGFLDAGFRVWYEKISLDFSVFGRAGYSWDDGLGLSLSSRAYNNWFTYNLVRAIGQLRLAILGYAFWGGMVLYLVSYYEFGYFYFFFIILLVSPLILQVYFNLSKPEVFWWFLAPLISYYSFSDTPYFATLIWSFLAFVNAPSAFLIAACVLSSSVLYQLFVGNFCLEAFLLFILFGLPGVIKLLLRLLFMVNSGFLRIIGKEQTGLWKRGWFDFSKEYVTYLLVFLSYVFSLSSGGIDIITSAIICFPIILVSYLNYRLIYLNDIQSYSMLFLSSCIGLVSVFPDERALVCILLLSLRVVCRPSPSLNEDAALKVPLSIAFKDIIKSYPILSRPIKFSTLQRDPLVRIFDCIPEHSRIIIITDVRLRSSKYRRWIEVARFKLLEKRINQINDMYGGMQSKFIVRFTTSKYINFGLNDDYFDMLDFLNVDYIITLDDIDMDNVKSSGNVILQKKIEDFSSIYGSKVKPSLFKVKKNTESNSVKISFCQNYVEITAIRSGLFRIPFAYDPFLELKDESGSLVGIESVNNCNYLTDVSFISAKLCSNKKYQLTCKNKLFPKWGGKYENRYGIRS